MEREWEKPSTSGLVSLWTQTHVAVAADRMETTCSTYSVYYVSMRGRWTHDGGHTAIARAKLDQRAGRHAVESGMEHTRHRTGVD
jgi:hypothetical protein